MIVLGAGMLMTIGDATGEACDYPANANVRAGVVFDSGDGLGTYVGEGVVTGDVTAPSISSVITAPSITGTVVSS